ncbi:MAG TPA: hypothetical protein PKI11_06940 [Candidatus Hydrogenedentes bacterium]|nr:hypothetical protein [Candidatus Hydrogenedentota bacterium]HNT89171.1 hypothetical protein [Candidatus Hydrogenedentota bacterium]
MASYCVGALMMVLCAGDAMPRYVFINHAPGVAWSADKPESFTRDGFDEIRETIGACENPKLRLGVSFIFDFLNYDLDNVAQSLDRFLALSAETGVPVLVNLDGMNWWDHRPDLWNWWDPDGPGFDPENRRNVEWTGWGPELAVKIGWRNWGHQVRVSPMMNMASPAVIAAHQEALRRLLPRIAAWRRALPQDKQWLLGGVKLGHEASIGVNAYYYPQGNALADKPVADDPTYGLDFTKGWHGGLQPLGYAAATVSGVKDSGELTRDDVARIVHDYLVMLTEEARAAGLPRELVYTHQGGNHAPWDKTLPWWPAFTPHATPGWSLYFTDPASADGLGVALDTLGDGRWAAVEWWWQGDGEAAWRANFERTLSFRDCRFIAIYNWNCGLSLREHPTGIAALRSLICDWAR